MNNREELISIIAELIENEKTKGTDIKCLDKNHAPIIAQIISNYKLSDSNKNGQDKMQADMLFVGAPTGAGKDTLVRKIMLDNDSKKFVVLNMDMFRYYYYEISQNQNRILDKDFAITTNQISYELYYIIQEIILREFSGTNIIITGTIKDLEWVKQIVSRYKNDIQTEYNTSLITLAVPERESAISIYERYLNLVDSRDDTNSPLRYTELKYHTDTIKDFISNVQYFEENLKNNDERNLFDSIRVYRRSTDMFDLSEDTIIYDSEKTNGSESAISVINSIMHNNREIDRKRVNLILDIVNRNKGYLKSQGLYEKILNDLKVIIPKIDIDFDEPEL